MSLPFNQLTKDISNVDVEDILSCWQWCIADMKVIVLMSCMGDLFFLGNDDAIYWLKTDVGSLSKIANNLEQFEEALTDEENIDNWFFSAQVEQLLKAGKKLKENQVYSYKVMPVIGGDYKVENLDPIDMSVHFAFSGQICEQIKDLPDGTKVKIQVVK